MYFCCNNRFAQELLRDPAFLALDAVERACAEVFAQLPSVEVDGTGTMVVNLGAGQNFDGWQVTFTPGSNVVFEINGGVVSNWWVARLDRCPSLRTNGLSTPEQPVQSLGTQSAAPMKG